MSKTTERPEQFFLQKYGLSTSSLESAIGRVLGKRIDYADLYFEYQTSESISLEERIVKKVSKTFPKGSAFGRSPRRRPVMPTPMTSTPISFWSPPKPPGTSPKRGDRPAPFRSR
ncbi:MAG: hypothetical protein MPW14_01365 [Candidatus Manganitrophus sp.]|nr:MAG: hypothetical protein MPW14_01365 [Candidatus Manganitrophus sp.]